MFIARLACGCRTPIEKTPPAARMASIESSRIEPVRPRSTQDRRERTARIDQTWNHLIPFRAVWIVRRWSLGDFTGGERVVVSHGGLAEIIVGLHLAGTLIFSRAGSNFNVHVHIFQQCLITANRDCSFRSRL